MADYFADYPGDLTPEDREALDRPGFTVYVNGKAVSDAYFATDPPPTTFTNHQVVKLSAQSAEDARWQIVDALGREPEGLTVVVGKTV